MKLDKESTLKFLKKLNRQLLLKFSQMKSDFQKSPPINNQIKKKFLEWKQKFDHIVITILKQCQQIDQKSFDFKQFIVWMTDQFGSDQQFLESLKNVNSSIQTLKDFIRVNLIKDPTIYDSSA